MPITKNALVRYHTLDRCFQNPGRNYDVKALLQACNGALRELDPNSDGIRRRQLYEDIKFMESEQGYGVELVKSKEGRKVYYRYADTNFSIRNQPINELEAEQLKSAMLILRRFKGLRQFEWIHELLPKLDQTFKLVDAPDNIIAFESNPYTEGIDYIDPIFNAILYKKTLAVKYQSFRSDQFREFIFSPYHLKQFNSRWFVFGRDKAYETITNLALDRILQIEDSSEPFIENKHINFDEYFDDVIGVTVPNDQEPILIDLQVDKDLAPYIRTKPLHGSQRPEKVFEDYSIFTIEVIPNFELEKLLLSFGEQLEVLAPSDFRDKIRARIQKNVAQYG